MSSFSKVEEPPYKEVEIKAIINKQDFLRLQQILPSISKYLGKKKQEDIYLNNPENTFIFLNSKGFKDANDYLRIRKATDGIKGTLCFKKVHRKGNVVYCDEHEVIVDDYRKTLKIFEDLGYVEHTNVNKIRERYLYEEYEISLDELEGLGYFIEVELKKNVDNVFDGLLEIENFMKDQLNLQSYRKQTHGYLSMIWNPTYTFDEITSVNEKA